MVASLRSAAAHLMETVRNVSSCEPWVVGVFTDFAAALRGERETSVITAAYIPFELDDPSAHSRSVMIVRLAIEVAQNALADRREGYQLSADALVKMTSC